MTRLSRAVPCVAVVFVLLSFTTTPVNATEIQTLTIDSATLEEGNTLVTVTGTIQCTVPPTCCNSLNVRVQQSVRGKNKVIGSGNGGSPPFLCTGIPETWEAQADSGSDDDPTPFHPGPASVTVEASTCCAAVNDQAKAGARVKLE